MCACVSQMLPELRGSKTDLRRGFADMKTRHTDAHWCSQPDNSVAPHWSWISRNVFADISAGVEVFFWLFYIFRKRQRQTHPSKQTHTYGGFSFGSFWTGLLPLNSATVGHRENRPKQSPQSPKYPQQNNRNAKYFNPTQATAYVGLQVHSLAPNTSLSFNIRTYVRISAYCSYLCTFSFCWLSFLLALT